MFDWNLCFKILLSRGSNPTSCSWTCVLGSRGVELICSDSQALVSSVQFSHSVVSDSLRPHGPQHARPPFSSVQLLSRVWLFATPWTAARQASMSITNSRSPPKPMSIESVMPSSHLILCRPLLLLLSIFPSIRVFSNESALHNRWPKYWSFSFNISPSNEHPGLISFRMDWFDLLAVQGILKSLLQHHSLKASIPQALNLLYGPTFTSKHDYWKNCNFDYTDLCW